MFLRIYSRPCVTAIVTGLIFLNLVAPGDRLLASATVTNCTQSALLDALATGDEVIFACDGALSITNTILISGTVTITATGQNTSITGVGGTNGIRLFLVQPGANLTLRNLTLMNGTITGEAGQTAHDGTRGAGAA